MLRLIAFGLRFILFGSCFLAPLAAFRTVQSSERRDDRERERVCVCVSERGVRRESEQTNNRKATTMDASASPHSGRRGGLLSRLMSHHPASITEIVTIDVQVSV